MSCIPDDECSIARHETQGTGLAELLALQAKLDAQEARFEVLESTVARLKEQLAAARKDSSTSSRPPSSDIVKPPKSAPPEGQQRHHRRATRSPKARTRRLPA